MHEAKNALSTEYVYDIERRVWHRDNYTSIPYSDSAESEAYLAKAVRSAVDLSLASAELAEFCQDWTSTYHLSPLRANLLRPLAHLIKGSILEVGAGCGAITRYLGESGAEVIAVEGTFPRATIAASRTRDLPNVTVVVEQFEHLETEQRFDVVTLIGVLEYAALFNPSAAPHSETIKRAQSLLKPGGVLILAIENKLGLKYLAGLPEDHLGLPYVGVEDLYDSKGVKTFDRNALANLLVGNGFEQVEFAFPFPDYKLPYSVITPAGLDKNGFDAAALAAQTVTKDIQLDRITQFSLENTWRSVGKAGLLGHLSNSFLVVASIDRDQGFFDPRHLAYFFTADRRPQFCKQAVFSTEGEKITVKRTPIYLGREIKLESSFHWHLENEPYTLGPSLAEEFQKSLARENWQPHNAIGCFRRFVEAVVTEVRKTNPSFQLSSASDPVPGYLIDMLPQNVIIGADNQAIFIDREWIASSSIEVGYLLFRSIASILTNTSQLKSPASPDWSTRSRFIISCFQAIGLQPPASLEPYFAMEEQLYHLAYGKNLKVDWTLWLNQKISSLNDQLSEASETSASEIEHLTKQLIATTEALSTAERLAYERQEELAVSTDRIIRAENALAHAEKLAIERLRSLEAYENRLRKTEEALARVSRSVHTPK